MQAHMLAHNGVDVSVAFDDSEAVARDGTWAISTPMEFNGKAFNLYGGWTLALKQRVLRVLDLPNGSILALEKPLPQLSAILRDRAIKADLDLSDAEWSEIDRRMASAELMTHQEIVGKLTRVVLGDSHSISRYEPGSLVLRNDGLTLHGLLKRGIASYLPDDSISHLVINAGNIDVRHHLCRRDDPIGSATRLITELRDQLVRLQDDGRIGTFEVTDLYPIEFEGRRIPKTGWYKGSPFYGTRDERNDVRRHMSMMFDDLFENVHAWPALWYVMDPQEYATTYMEKPQSVHLSPAHYPFNIIETSRRNTQAATPAMTLPTIGIEPTIYYEDFARYYEKAITLQRINIASKHGRDTSEPLHVDDPLMHYVTIYDVVERRYAGFSNAIQQIWYGSDNPKRWQINSAFDGIHHVYGEREWLWLFLIHRVTGSGASFAHDHGFRNSILADLATNALTVNGMRDYTLSQMADGRAIFTSIGNQIPPFPKPQTINGRSMRGSEVYISNYMTDLVDHVHRTLNDAANPPSIAAMVDNVCDWHVEHGLKQFKFVLTAWIMDIAEYFPHWIEPYSRVHYGANCIEAFDLLFKNNGMKKRDFYDACMDRICADHLSDMPDDRARGMGRAYSLEDVACDYIRYVECYVPAGYEHLENWQVENRSLVPDHPKHHSWHKHVARPKSVTQEALFDVRDH